MISTTVHCVADAVFCQCHEAGTSRSENRNALTNQLLPNVEACEFSYNSEMNRFYSYRYADVEDIVTNYHEARTYGDDNNVSLELVAQGFSYRAGLNYRQSIDLHNRKFD